MTFKRLESFGHLRDVDADAGTVISVIATGNVARDGVGIDPQGWNLATYAKNPVVLWMHDDHSMPFAKTVGDVHVGDTELVARAQFDMEDPRAQELVRKIANGYVNATSVRWLPHKTEMRSEGEGKDKKETLWFVDQELLEWSFVSIPADPGAVILRADGTSLDLAEYGAVKPPESIETLKETAERLRLASWQQLEDSQAETEHLRTTIADLEARLRVPPDEDKLTELLVAFATRKRPDITEKIIAGLVRATGKTPERIRQEMAGGGN